MKISRKIRNYYLGLRDWAWTFCLPRGWYICRIHGQLRKLYWDKGGWYSEEWLWVPSPTVKLVVLTCRSSDKSGIKEALNASS